MEKKDKILKGIITKGIGGFYYVMTEEGIIESHARGVFRDDKLTPVIGDRVSIRISDEDNKGYIIDLEDRDSQLIRPSVANVTKAFIVMSVKKPDINFWLLDKFLIMAEHENLDIVVCINKIDLDRDEANRIKDIYIKAGYDVILSSSVDDIGIDKLKESMKNNISVLAGPSGAGKSSILNMIGPDLELEVGDVSAKTKRGKHTTRHVELIRLEDKSYVLDTPGFSSMNLNFIEHESELRYYFREIDEYGQGCKFHSCLHDKEPDCAVKENVETGEIDKIRYESYLLLLDEVRNIRRY